VKSLLISLALALCLPVVGAAPVAAEPVARPLLTKTATKLPFPATYQFRFSLWDGPTGDAGATEAFAEEARIRITSAAVTHALGSVDAAGWAAVDFSRQFYLQVERYRAGIPVLATPQRVKLQIVPYALWSASADVGSVSSVAIVDGSVTANDLQDGAALTEILDDDGSGSGLDADVLDGEHAGAFADAAHDHGSAYVATGAPGSVTSTMILDGTIGNADIQPGAGITDSKLAPITTPGKVADSALPAGVARTGTDQAVTGLWNFQTAAGVPFAVDAANRGMVANLCAERAGVAEAALSAQDAATVGGLSIAELDARYGAAPAPMLAMPMFTSAAVYGGGDASTVMGTTSIAIGVDGNPVIADTLLQGGRLTRCTDAACGMMPVSIAIDPEGRAEESVSVAVGADGLPIVAYQGWNAAAARWDLKVAQCSNASCMSLQRATVATAAHSISLAIGIDGLPVIAYGGDDGAGGQALRVAHCGNAACSAGNTLTVVDDSADVIGWEASIVIGADGLPVIAYRDGTNQRVKLARCGNAACSAGNTLSVVAPAVQAAPALSLAIGADGLPVIAHADASGALWVTHCGAADCSGAQTSTMVDVAALSGVALTIGDDGLPVIAYGDHRADRLDLRVARCGNAACTSGNTLATADADGDLGIFRPSISIGADGRSVIAYVVSRPASYDLTFARGYFRPLGRR
jgi:hypothetical protein